VKLNNNNIPEKEQEQSNTNDKSREMDSLSGYNFQAMKMHNSLLILKTIATDGPISRVELSYRVGLTKTTLGKRVSDLMESRLVCETESNGTVMNTSPGRRPILLKISDESPCICGILIKRQLCIVILSDISGNIIDKISREFKTLANAEQLIRMIYDMYTELHIKNMRKICAIGISCIGPVDATKGCIINPPNFYNIKDVPICDIFYKKTGLPCYIINDSNAGAMAERLYGQGKQLRSFVYLHIMNGIGSGYILDYKLYNGNLGQSGEIGHTTINFNGPVCDCGNVGCLELYANLKNMNLKIRNMQESYDKKSIYFKEEREYTLEEILTAADKADSFAISAVDEFCGYLSWALISVINILDVNYIIIGYDCESNNPILEKVLSQKIKNKPLITQSEEVLVKKSKFHGNAPLYGSIALIADKIFEGQLPFCE
jgi:predicted NBD/HSP70 family sugar kinase